MQGLSLCAALHALCSGPQQKAAVAAPVLLKYVGTPHLKPTALQDVVTHNVFLVKQSRMMWQCRRSVVPSGSERRY